MNIDWDTNIILLIGSTIGWIVGTTSGAAWYWFPAFMAGALLAMIAYDVAKSAVIHVRTHHD